VFGGAISSFLGLVLEALVCPRYQRGRPLALLLGYALVESLGYRQLTAWWRVQGLWRAMTRESGWGEMSRKGYADGLAAAPPAPRAAA
jgi:hypothetical protein